MYAIAIGLGILSYKSIPTIGKLALWWTILSSISDGILAYLGFRHQNNFLFFNIYDYLSFTIEIAIAWKIGFLNQKIKPFLFLLLLLFLGIHAFYNVQYGFHQPYPDLSNAMSLVLSLVFGGLIIFILSRSETFFQHHKQSLLILFGAFVFEASCAIPALSTLIKIPKEQKTLMIAFSHYSVLSGSVLKSALFSIYFLAKFKKNSNS
jgi:hypothetical protein